MKLSKATNVMLTMREQSREDLVSTVPEMLFLVISENGKNS